MHESDKQERMKNLAVAIAKVREVMAEADRYDVEARHEVARIVLDVKNSAKYGENAIDRIQEELGLDQATLYRYARVAEVWSATEFKSVSAKPNGKGLPLSWSHWELLAGVEDGRTRRGLVERTVSASLTVRGLREAIKEGSASAKSSLQLGRGSGGASKSLVRVGAFVETIEQEAQALERSVLAKLTETGAKLSMQDRTYLRDSQKRLEDAVPTLMRLVGAIGKVLASSTREAPIEAVATVHGIQGSQTPAMP